MESFFRMFQGQQAVPAEEHDQIALVSFDRVRNIFSGGQAEEQSPQTQTVLSMLGIQQPKDYCGFQLTWKQRLYAFGICFGIGLLFTLLSVLAIFLLQFVAFGVLYSFGSICSILCTGFLVGPMTQLKWMFKEKRLLATIAYLCSIALTLVAAFKLGNFIVVLLCVVLQFAALAWYCYTYINPF